MSVINEIIDVTITKETASVSRVGFGVANILGLHRRFNELIKFYSDLDSVGADFLSTDKEYIAASKILGQSPRPTQIAISRRATADLLTLTVNALQADTDYTVGIDGVNFTTQFSPAPADLATAAQGVVDMLNANNAFDVLIVDDASADLATLIATELATAKGSAIVDGDTFRNTGTGDTLDNALAGIKGSALAANDVFQVDDAATPTVSYLGSYATVTNHAVSAAVGAAGAFDLTAKAASTQWSLSGTSSNITEPTLVPSQAIGDDLTDINDDNSDWYFLMYTGHAEADVLNIAAWTETQFKVYGTSSNDTDIVDTSEASDTTSIAAQLKALAYERTFLCYSAVADTEYLEAACLGIAAPRDPGSYTMEYKTAVGVTVDKLNSTQRTNAADKYAWTHTTVADVNVLRNTRVMKGFFFDLEVFVDWLQARIQEGIFVRLVNSEKIPYTDAGIAVIEGEIRNVLTQGVAVGGLAPDPAPTVTVPKASSVPANDKANRFLDNVTFEGTSAGAIHTVKIRGKVVL